MSQPDTTAPTSEPDDRWSTTVASDGYFAGGKLLLSDARLTLALLNEARCRSIERLFGVSRDSQFLLTLILVGMSAQAVERRVKQALGLTAMPSQGDTVLGAGLLKEGAHAIAGDWSRETPLFGTLVVIVVVSTAVRPAVRASAHGLRRAGHLVRYEFDHRYGHLIRRNRPAHPHEDRARESAYGSAVAEAPC